MNGWQREAIAAETYAAAVIDVLAPEFPDLRNAETAAIVRGHIYAHAREPAEWMEVIVDSPRVAMWRLVANRDNHGRVRVGCWRQRPLNDRYREQLERLNAALRAIPMEVQR